MQSRGGWWGVHVILHASADMQLFCWGIQHGYNTADTHAGICSAGKACSTATADMPLQVCSTATATADMLIFCYS